MWNRSLIGNHKTNATKSGRTHSRIPPHFGKLGGLLGLRKQAEAVRVQNTTPDNIYEAFQGIEYSALARIVSYCANRPD